ncbi:MAG: hypothetical protein AVDCRST_MAG55-87 [uncultured Rubrobacteraceae bacterium]|uniref:AB hydrolase-1 domain-containing protein n=1 Tax=uncultured Rubrobacteraceae bacterium TaxID=349277 RepID=A0A6J4NLH9_9ACTN|nr:MAG: hypothetical protein AVDCRST_MAG55-87 [uncultured Rubrobacteraceae bacterium]
MTTHVLIPGAGGEAWYWHLLEAELRERGREALPVDLPADDDSTGFSEYADAVVGAIGGRTGLVDVAQSLGGFTAPLVCERVPVDLLVMLNAMVPSPGEPPEDWWSNTGFAKARAERADRGAGTSPQTRTRGRPSSTTSRPRSRQRLARGESRINPGRRSRGRGP